MSADTPAMKDPPAVALLFENTQQSAHLRAALLDLGARIVLEGPATDVQRDALVDSGADVVVISLDAAVEKHLDRIHDAIDGSHQRIVYNDADASSQLSGWAQARWARHLAAKLMGQFDTDPPRPQGARAVQVTAAPADVAEDGAPTQAQADQAPSAISAEQLETASLDSATLASELSALMAEGNDLQTELLGGDASDFAQIRRDDVAANVDADQPEAAFDGDSHVGAQQPEGIDTDASTLGVEAVAPDPAHESHGTSSDMWSLAAFEGDADSDVIGSATHAADPSVDETQEGRVAAVSPDWETVAPDAAQDEVAGPESSLSSPQAPEWDLVDPGAETDASHAGDQVRTHEPADDDAPLDPGTFGINKVSATEYLTPVGNDTGESPLEPGGMLELVSLEESMVPAMIESSGHEMSLDVSAGLRDVLVIGATEDSTESVCEFVHALETRPDAAMLLVQHQGDTSVEALRVRLAEVTAIPVRVAEAGSVVRRGELMLIAAGQEPHIDRAGRMRLDVATERGCAPSIDAAFTAVAAQFGADARALLLVSDANDAIAGAQAIHDHGGRVWLHHHADDAPSSLVSMLREEGLVDSEDTPAAFATRLLNEAGAL